MARKSIASACQGGGSQCAFIAGALKTLFSQGVQNRFRIVGLSGTSGGALTAALAWQGLLKQAQGDSTPAEQQILAFWKDLTAQTPLEMALDAFSIQLLRLVESGLLPSVASSPSSLAAKFLNRGMADLIARPEFTDLGALLERHLDFASWPSLVKDDSPALLVGAVDVLEGSFKIFSSARNEITVDSLLASAAIPNLFPAAPVDGHFYWDGIFSANPPVVELLRERFVGRDHLPKEIWIIQVNRPQHDFVPELPSDIFDRRNHLAGNLSLQHELQFIEMVNMLLAENALTEHFRARFGLEMTETVKVRFIRMSRGLQDDLDYPSKLSRQPRHIARLIADGEAQAREFLNEIDKGDPVTDVPVIETVVELH